jgi:hypothetical protein
MQEPLSESRHAAADNELLGAAEILNRPVDNDYEPQRKSLLWKIAAALAPRFCAEEKIVYETQTWPARAGR